MRITLPVSQKEMEIPVVSHKDGKALDALRYKAADGIRSIKDYASASEVLRKRDEIMDALLVAQVPGYEDLPHRDVIILRTVTYAYAMGEPVAAIKNLLDGGDGAATAIEQSTASTASE